DGTPPAGTPLAWRAGVALAVMALGLAAYLARDELGPRGQAACGVVCFIGLVAALSTNLRAVNLRTVARGFGLQLALGLSVTQFPPGYALFEAVTDAVKQLLAFTDDGARFVFGKLANPSEMNRVFGGGGFVFAFSALPTIIFIASFFSVLYYFGILQ